MQRQSPHSSIPNCSITTSQPGCDSSSPTALNSDVPLGPSPRCIAEFHNEADCNLAKRSADLADNDSESMDMVLTILDPENEASVNASFSDNTTGAALQMNDVDTYEHDSLAGQEIGTGSPSNGVNCITPDKPDDRHDIDEGNFVKSAARGYLSPVSLPSESSERGENMSPKRQS